MDELTIGDKIYISSKRAAAITGYAKDYVGQLCREGHVEAKMVGRSWYVLESSIREHRFGKPEVSVASPELREKEAIATEALINATVGTWEAPKYIPEEAPKMPEIVPMMPVTTVPETPGEGHESINEMQAAWKEWFESKQELQEPRLESPEVIEAREEAEEAAHMPLVVEKEAAQELVEEPVPVVVHKISTPDVHMQAPVAPPVSQPVPIAVIATPIAPSAPSRRVRARSRRGRGSSLIVKALVVVFIGAVILVATVGSGFGGDYLQNNSIIRYLGGTSSINK